MRNLFVAALSGSAFMAHAASGSMTERLFGVILDWKLPVYTHPENENLLEQGALPWNL